MKTMNTINMRQWALLVGRTFGHGWAYQAGDGWPTCNSVDICNDAQHVVEALRMFQDALNEDDKAAGFAPLASAANNFLADAGLLHFETPSRFYGWCQPERSHIEARFTSPEYFLIVKTFPGAYRLIAPSGETLTRMVREKAPHGAIGPIVDFMIGLDRLGLACVNEADKNRFVDEYRAWAGGN